MSVNYKSNIWKLNLYSILGHLELVAPVFFLFLMSKDLSMTQIMILQAYYTMMILVLEVPSGVFADLFGLRNSIALSAITYSAGFFAYGMADSMLMFVLAETLIAMSWSMYSGTDSALIYDSLNEVGESNKFQKYRGLNIFFIMGILGVASLAGGFLAESIDWKYLFFFPAFVSLLSLIVIFSIKEPKKHKKIYDKNYFKHLKEGLGFVRKHAKVKKYIIYISFFGACGMLLYFFMQPYFEQGGLPYKFIGLGVSGFFFIYAFGALFTERISKMARDDDKVLLFSLLVVAGLYYLIVFSNVWVGMILILIAMFFSAIKETIVDFKVNKLVPSSHRATILSIKNMSENLFYTILAPIIGVLMDVWSTRVAMLMIGISLTIFWVLMVIMFKNSSLSTSN